MRTIERKIANEILAGLEKENQTRIIFYDWYYYDENGRKVTAKNFSRKVLSVKFRPFGTETSDKVLRNICNSVMKKYPKYEIKFSIGAESRIRLMTFFDERLDDDKLKHIYRFRISHK